MQDSSEEQEIHTTIDRKPKRKTERYQVKRKKSVQRIIKKQQKNVRVY